MDVWQEILALTLTPAAIVAVGAYMLRKFFEQGLKRDIEAFKITLQSELETAKMNLDAQLNSQLFEHKTKFSFFFQKQAEVIGRAFELLVEVELFLSALFVNQYSEEDYRKASSLIWDLKTYFRKNEIYFPVEISRKMNSALEMLSKAFVTRQTGEQLIRSGQPQNRDLIVEAGKMMEKEFPVIKKDLTSLFRAILTKVAPMAA